MVLLVVLFVQAGFNAWQDFSTSRVMSSITGMLPSDVLVLRDANQMRLSASNIVVAALCTPILVSYGSHSRDSRFGRFSDIRVEIDRPASTFVLYIAPPPAVGYRWLQDSMPEDHPPFRPLIPVKNASATLRQYLHISAVAYRGGEWQKNLQWCR